MTYYGKQAGTARLKPALTASRTHTHTHARTHKHIHQYANSKHVNEIYGLKHLRNCEKSTSLNIVLLND